MAASEVELTRSIAVFSVLSLFLTVATMIIGTLAIGLIGDLGDSDRLIPMLFSQLGKPFVPILVLGTFAAGMSTIDSQLLSTSSVLLRDLIKPLGLWSGDSRKEQLLGKCIVILLIITISFLALFANSQGAIFTLASKGVAFAFLLLIPLILIVQKEEEDALVGISVLLIGIICLISLETECIKFTLPYGFGHPITAFLVQLLGVLVYGLVSYSRDGLD